MGFIKSTEFRLTLKTLTLLILLFTLTTAAVSTANGDESLNTTSQETDTAVNIKDSNDYSSGDSYLDEAYEECVVAKDTAPCAKYEALKYIHELTSPHAEEEGRANEGRPEFQLWGPMKLIPLLPENIPTDLPTLFSDLDSRSTDSEFMRLFRFTLREIGRFLGSYALAISFPNVSSTGRGMKDFETPKFFDDDFFSGSFREVASRGKKKTLMYLLPLVSFFHLKALLVPILLAVLFMKKLMVLGIIFLPSLLSLVKWCKPQHHHYSPWIPDHEPPSDYHAEYTPHYDSPGTQESEDHWMMPDSWTGSKTYPAVNRNSWDNPRRWLDSIVSPSVVATNKEFVTRKIAMADETREQINGEFLDEKIQPKWKENQHGVEEGNEGIHYGLAMSNSWDKDVRPLYQQIISNIDGDFLRMKSRDTEAQEGNPEDSKEQHSTTSWRNEFFWGKDLGSVDRTKSDKKTVHEDATIGAFLQNSNNWPDGKHSELPDSSLARQTEKNHDQIIAADAVTGDEAMSDYLRSFYSRLRVQNNDPRGAKHKKKCDHDNDSSVPTAHTEYGTDKDTLATKALISSSYSNSRNQRF